MARIVVKVHEFGPKQDGYFESKDKDFKLGELGRLAQIEEELNELLPGLRFHIQLRD